MFKLIKANPPELRAKSVVEYAKLMEQMLGELNHVIPKMCVPIQVFKKMEKESQEISQLAENYMREHRRSLIEVRVLEDRLRETEEREKILI